MTPDKPSSLADLLAFYAEAGVDEPLGEEPIDRFAESLTRRTTPSRQAPASQPVPAAARPVQAAPVVPDEAQALLARESAAAANTLEELRDAMTSFEGCNLRLTAKNLVFADGNPQADLMLVGEAPGRDEDIEGLHERLYCECHSLAPSRKPDANAYRNRNLPSLHRKADRACLAQSAGYAGSAIVAHAASHDRGDYAAARQLACLYDTIRHRNSDHADAPPGLSVAYAGT
jgi:hypothetical protein